MTPFARPRALLLHDPSQHGVASYARRLAVEINRLNPEDRLIEEAAWSDTSFRQESHAHFTDRLWASDLEGAASRFEELAERSATSVTVHDVPQESDGRNYDRRVDAYRRVAAAAAIVVVNSEHERSLLSECGIETRVEVIPLPVDTIDPVERRRDDGLLPAVGIVGFIYPGKGHREAIDAAAGMPLAVIALGDAAPGHDRDVIALRERAHDMRVEFDVTGYQPDDVLRSLMSRVAVPLVAHQHFSASGSMNSWLSVGRRPIPFRSRYTEEMERLRPGTLNLIGPTDLRTAVSTAQREPESTFLASTTSLHPTLRDTALAYLDVWRAR